MTLFSYYNSTVDIFCLSTTKLFILGDTVFLGGAASTPIPLIKAMTEHGKKSSLRNVTVCHIHTEGAAEYTAPECEGEFISCCSCLHSLLTALLLRVSF